MLHLQNATACITNNDIQFTRSCMYDTFGNYLGRGDHMWRFRQKTIKKYYIKATFIASGELRVRKTTERTNMKVVKF